MPDKRRERFYLDALLKALPDFPGGAVEESEPPDFVIRAGTRRIGVEFTLFHLPPQPGERPHQEQQSLKDRCVRIAQEFHHAQGGRSLYVSVFFRAHPVLDKNHIRPLAQAISRAVLTTDPPTQLPDRTQVSWESLPGQVAAIHIAASVDGIDQLWYADAGGWVAEITPHHVATVIQSKARRAAGALSKCDELWLVIVEDPFSRAAPAEISEIALAHPYDHPFDRVLWLHPHRPLALDLKRADPAA